MVDIGRGGNFGSTGDPTSLHLEDEVISVPGGIGGEDGGGNGGNGYSGGGGGGANGYPAGDGGWDGGNVISSYCRLCYLSSFYLKQDKVF